MTLKQLSVIALLTVFFHYLSLPVVSCLHNCRWRSERCHRPVLVQPGPSNCSHGQPVSAVEVKAGCACAMQATSPVAREVEFNLDSFRAERSKVYGVNTQFSPKVSAVVVEARLHGPPFPLISHRQDTFLINSTLRI